jgi:uncharacterized protein YjiS (DUF1127 family)
MNRSHPSGAALSLPATHSALAARADPTPGLLARASAMFVQWTRRRGARYDLGQLDARLLRDIGLTREEVAHERSKYFWQA